MGEFDRPGKPQSKLRPRRSGSRSTHRLVPERKLFDDSDLVVALGEGQCSRPAAPIVKIDLDAMLASGEPIVLELGCGTTSRAGRIGLDLIDGEHVDVVVDLERDGLSFLPDDSVDAIYSHHVLEHIQDLPTLVAETVRVLKPQGYHYAVVPHFSNPFYYSDPTHKRPFGLYTMSYFAHDTDVDYERTVPDHYTGAMVQIHEQVLWFRSVFDSNVLRRSHRLLNGFINRSPRMQEFYEEYLVWLVPCYEVRIRYGPARGEA